MGALLRVQVARALLDAFSDEAGGPPETRETALLQASLMIELFKTWSGGEAQSESAENGKIAR